MAENETLGNYRVLKLIGDGGFSKVYLGEHLYLKTFAAIKVPKLQLDAADLEDFLNEARRGVGLRHPNVLRTLECGVEGGTQPYIVMDYAPGGSLRRRYPLGTIVPPVAIITYARQAGAGLQYIHDQRLIHQDIKPGNMMLGSNDELMLGDFGIAVVAHHTTTQSMSDATGTARYMAPEQFRGKARPASDQYALAIVIYEWICGSAPFTGDIAELYYKHTHLAPPPLHEKAPAISPTVEQVILQALAKDPRDRFPNVQDFVTALEQAGRPGVTSSLQRVSGPIPTPPPLVSTQMSSPLLKPYDPAAVAAVAPSSSTLSLPVAQPSSREVAMPPSPPPDEQLLPTEMSTPSSSSPPPRKASMSLRIRRWFQRWFLRRHSPVVIASPASSPSIVSGIEDPSHDSLAANKSTFSAVSASPLGTEGVGSTAAQRESPPKWEVSQEDIATQPSATYPGQALYPPAPNYIASTQAFQSSLYPQSQLQDCFILYHRADRQWAEWIAWQLENERYSTILPVWSVIPGTDLEMELRKAAAKAKRTIILLSPYFFRAFAAKPDWIEPLKQRMVSEQNSLVAIYMRDYNGKHKKYLESIHYFDLSREEETAARKILLEVMREEYIVPDVAPVFPGRHHRHVKHDKSAPGKKSSMRKDPAEPQEVQPPAPSFSESAVTWRASTLMQEIELAFAQEDWPAVIRKIDFLEKQIPHLLSDQLYYMQGKALLEEGQEEPARKALNYAFALISDQQLRLALLRDCARLMTAHGLWSEVLRYSNEALKLLPNDLDWLVIQEKAQKQMKGVKGTSPLPPPKGVKAVEVFFSYSHHDKKYRTELENYLSHLKRISSPRSWRIEAWYDGEVGAGREYAQEISKHLSEAQVILLLISQAFIASEYCYDIEMQKALERHEAGEARVIPIILRPANWIGTPIDKPQVLPTDAKPILKWSRREDAFMDVARGVQKEIEKLLGIV